jgi:NADH-quinone oxidoreductase subunit M
MSFLGAYQAFGWVTVPAIGCVVVTALYVLRAAAVGLYGPRREAFDKLADLRRAEMVPVILLGGVMVIAGFFPSLLFNVINAGMELLCFLN